MPTVNEIQIAIKAQDQATAVFRQIQSEAKNLGGNIERDTKTISEGFKRAGQDTSNFKNFMKEAKQENRQHNFVIGEMMDVLGGVSLAIKLFGGNSTETDKVLKNLSGSVMNGVAAFRALEFAMGFLTKKSWVGLAIAGIGAVATTIYSYIDTGKEVIETNKKVTESFENLNVIDQILGKQKYSIDELKKIRENLNAQLNEGNKLNLEGVRGFDEASKAIETNRLKKLAWSLGNTDYRIALEQGIKTIDGMIKSQEILNKVLSKSGGAFKIITDSAKQAAKDLEDFEKNFTKLWRKISVEFEKKQNQFQIKPVVIPDQAVKTLQDILDEEDKQFNATMDLALQGFGILSQFGTQMSNQKIFELERERNFRLSMIDEELNAENLSEERKKELIAERKRIEDASNAEIRAEKIKSFESGKKLAIAEALINGYVAVSKVWGQTGIGGFALAPIVAALVAAQVALIASQEPRFHTGGEAFIDAPANRDVPILVRGQERIKVTTPGQSSSEKSITINFNSPVSDVAFVTNSIKKVLASTGLNVNNAFVTNRNKLSFA